MGRALPSAIAIVRFYQVFAVLAMVGIITVAVWVRRQRQCHNATDYPYPQAYRWLARGLAGLWILDGLLQAQPLMNTHFINGILAPSIQSQPAPLAFAIKLGIRLWAWNPVAWNEVAVWVQITIGLMILLGGLSVWRRRALWMSLGWGLIVWIVGEAMGSLFVEGSWVIAGSPGSVLFYILVAILLLLPAENWNSRASRGLRWGFAGLWGLSTVLQVLPASGWWGASLYHGVLSMAQAPQPEVLSAPLYIWAHLIHAHPIAWNGTLVAIFGILALLWVIFPKSPLTWGVTTLITFLTWWLGQDFGVLGGMGTDANSGAILLLILAGYALLTPHGSSSRSTDEQAAQNPSRSNLV